MAGDWIKMRIDLAEDPAVIGMAESLGMDEFAVVGRLHVLWGWADSQSRDGHARGVTEKWIDRKVQRDGFAAAMAAAGWLLLGDGGIEFPNFDRHNGETAKQRGLAANRKKKSREKVTQDVTDVSRTERDETATREEKRRHKEIPPADAAGSPSADLKPKAKRPPTITEWLASLGDADAIPETDPVYAYAEKAGIPDDFLLLSWAEFKSAYTASGKRQKDFPATYRNAVKGNWYKLWWITPEGEYRLTTAGEQAKRAQA